MFTSVNILQQTSNFYFDDICISMNNISFKGTYVSPATIYKKGEPVRAAIVKVDKSDLKSLAKVVDRWDTDLSDKIVNNLYYNEVPKYKNLYALSSQIGDYQKLDDKKVHALFEVDDLPKKYVLQYIEVDPKHQCGKNKLKRNPNRLSAVGTACLNFIKSKFAPKKITELYALEEAKPFYEAFGCKKAPSETGSKYIIEP